MVVLAIFFLGYLFESFLPWWSVALAAAVGGALVRNSVKKAFIAGFLGIGLLWLLNAGYFHFRSGGMITTRVAAMVNVPWPVLLIIVTGLIGALVGGIAACAGFYLRAAVQK